MFGTIINDTYVKNEKEKSKLRMGGGSWSIPYELVSKSKHLHVKDILYRTPKVLYTITIDSALSKGFILSLGGELKLVVPIKHWTKESK